MLGSEPAATLSRPRLLGSCAPAAALFVAMPALASLVSQSVSADTYTEPRYVVSAAVLTVAASGLGGLVLARALRREHKVDRWVVARWTTLGGLLLAALLVTVMVVSDLGSTPDDGADIGGPILAILLGAAIAPVGLIPAYRRIHYSDPASLLAPLWTAVTMDAAIQALGATDLSYALRLVTGTSVSLVLITASATMSAAVAASAPRHGYDGC